MRELKNAKSRCEKKMMNSSFFENALSALSDAIILAKPIFSHGEICDFKIIYVNKKCEQITKIVLERNSCFSKNLSILSSVVDFVAIGRRVITSLGVATKEFYSSILNLWLKIDFSKTQDGNLIMSIHDVSRFVETEKLLKQQNLRLESLSEELIISKQELKNELEKIESLNKELEHLAYFDKLTEIPNRAKMLIDLERILAKAAEYNSHAGVMVIDVDNLKKVNDSMGHTAGDELLKRTADVLKKLCSDTLSVYRFGGDEFLVVVNDVFSKDYMGTVGDTVIEELNKENINVSAGIAMYPHDSKKLDELVKYADMAMYEVKKNGKNDVYFFQQLMQEKFVEKICLENKLTDALDTSCLELYFQPQVDITTKTLRGFEALVRWYDPELGWIKPDEFIPMAEESRLIIPLGDWVLDTSCFYLSKWQKEFDFNGIMSINVSPVQLKNPTFLFDLNSAIRRHNVDPCKIEIEITEGIFIDNLEDTVDLLTRIKNLGVGISLDDFGTGYASLSYLQALPLTTLKIDKSFIANITSETGKEANITNAIVSLVTKMGLDTIAEGVENPEQLEVLESINCKNTQGFLMGKPMPASLCERMLAGDESAIVRSDSNPLLYKI